MNIKATLSVTALSTLLSISCATSAARGRPVDLSEFFAVERVSGGVGLYKWVSNDIYEHRPDGELRYVGTSTGGAPGGVGFLGDEIQDLHAITLAISEDGRSVVFRYQASRDPRRPKLEFGIHQYTHGKEVRLLYRQDELSGLSWSRRDTTFPTDILPFKFKTTYTPEDMTWAVTATGEVFPLALLGASPLHWAAFEGRTIDCVGLVEDGADIDARTFFGFTSLDLAIIRDRQDTANKLVSLGADPDLGIYPSFHRAVQLGRMSVVQAMLERGADPNAADEQGNTPLHLAIYAGSRQVGGLSRFFDNAETPRSIMDKHITTPLIRLLLEHGADPTLRNKANRSPLDEVNPALKEEVERAMNPRD